LIDHPENAMSRRSTAQALTVPLTVAGAIAGFFLGAVIASHGSNWDGTDLQPVAADWDLDDFADDE
jgi:hypothetical protein